MKRCLFAAYLSIVALFAQAPAEIALITSSKTSEHWKSVHAGALKAQQELKAAGMAVNVTWEASPTAAHVQEQKKLVEAATVRKVAGIVLAPCDVRALVPAVEAAAKAKVPTVVIDASLATAAQVGFVGTDNFKGGVLGAKRLGTLLGGKGKVAVFRAQKGRASTDQREEGFLSAIKSQYPGIQVVSADRYAGASQEEAKRVAAELLKQHGSSLNGIFASNSTSSLALVAALREAGLGGGKVKCVTFDASTEMVAALKSGDVQGIVAQNPFEIGYRGVKSLASHLKGESIEREVQTTCAMITAENLQTPAIAALLKTNAEALK